MVVVEVEVEVGVEVVVGVVVEVGVGVVVVVVVVVVVGVEVEVGVGVGVEVEVGVGVEMTKPLKRVWQGHHPDKELEPDWVLGVRRPVHLFITQMKRFRGLTLEEKAAICLQASEMPTIKSTEEEDRADKGKGGR